jgi:dTDP-4-amino-4,6-dideoxygalactose transaminase
MFSRGIQLVVYMGDEGYEGEMSIKRNIVSSEKTIRHVMDMLNGARIKLCVAVDSAGHLVRTISDGDIRRALLDGADINDAVSHLPALEPISFPEDTPTPTLMEALSKAKGIQAIVLIDGDNKPVKLVTRKSLQSDIILSPPHIGDAEENYVEQAFIDNWIAPAGPNLDAFECALAKSSGREYALALSSGTAAIHLCLRVLDIGPQHRVYVSDLTFAASLQPILYQGAEPVLIDSDPDNWNMSPQALERQLMKDAKSGALPAAIIVVHLYGQSADMGSIMALADKYHIPVIEDAAESIGASYQNRASGSHGLLSIYSFNGNKIITTSGGGALVSDRKDLVDKARKLSTQGRDSAEHYQHTEIAYNYRMSNVLAGIGLGQLEVLQDRVNLRRAIFKRYYDALKDIDGVRFQHEVKGARGNRWLTVISLDPDKIQRHPYQLMLALRKHGIESRPAWKPMHMQPLCAGLEFSPHSLDEAVSSTLFLQSLCLPSGSSLRKADQDRVIRIIRQFIEEQS